MLDNITYDPFGNTLTGTVGRFGFQGGQYDSNVAMYNYGQRWYDPSRGRWISQDPIGFDGGDSNLYRYVNNQPTDAVDPSGNDIVILFDPSALKELSKKGNIIGHPAILIGNDDTGWDYYSFSSAKNLPYGKGKLEHKFYKTLDLAKADKSLAKYKDHIWYKTGKDQDDAAKKAANTFEGKNYFAFSSNNCARLVYISAKAGGLQIPPYMGGFIPVNWWNDLRMDAKTNKAVRQAGPWPGGPAPAVPGASPNSAPSNDNSESSDDNSDSPLVLK